MSNYKLTSKFQVIIPKKVRVVLELKVGDRIIFEITNDKKVIVKKAKPINIA